MNLKECNADKQISLRSAFNSIFAVTIRTVNRNKAELKKNIFLTIQNRINLLVNNTLFD